MFKSRKQKEIEKKIAYNKTMSEMKRFINKLEKQKDYYIKLAIEAKKNGSEAQFSLAVSGLKMALAYQRKAQEMLLNFEITMQMRELTQITTEFLIGMTNLSKDMSKIISKQDYDKVTKEFEKAMGHVEEQNIKNETFMDETETEFKKISETTDPDMISDDEIFELINFEAGVDISQKDDEIDVKLDQIDDLLKDL